MEWMTREQIKIHAEANPEFQVGAGGGHGMEWMTKADRNALSRDEGRDWEDGRMSKRQKTLWHAGQVDEAHNAGIVVALLPQGFTFPGGSRQEEFVDPAGAERAISLVLGTQLSSGDVAAVIRNGKISTAGTQIRLKAELDTKPFIANYVPPTTAAQAVMKMRLVSTPTPFNPQQRVYEEVGRYSSIKQAVESVTTYHSDKAAKLKKAANDKSEWQGFFWKIEKDKKQEQRNQK
jgi:hypothetical protein